MTKFVPFSVTVSSDEASEASTWNSVPVVVSVRGSEKASVPSETAMETPVLVTMPISRHPAPVLVMVWFPPSRNSM